MMEELNVKSEGEKVWNSKRGKRGVNNGKKREKMH